MNLISTYDSLLKGNNPSTGERYDSEYDWQKASIFYLMKGIKEILIKLEHLDDCIESQEKISEGAHCERDFLQNLLVNFEKEIVEIVARNIVKGVKSKKELKKSAVPLVLTDEELDKFPYSEKLQLMDICRKLRKLREDDGNYKGINAVLIANWLIKEGLLEVVTLENNHNSKIATEKGKNLGMISILDENGTFYRTYYPEKIQKYIVSNYREIFGL